MHVGATVVIIVNACYHYCQRMLSVSLLTLLMSSFLQVLTGLLLAIRLYGLLCQLSHLSSVQIIDNVDDIIDKVDVIIDKVDVIIDINC